MVKDIKEILKLKEELCIERDRLGNLYNEYIEILVKNENNPQVYEEYVKKIEDLEPASKITKEKMREYNRILKDLGYFDFDEDNSKTKS